MAGDFFPSLVPPGHGIPAEVTAPRARPGAGDSTCVAASLKSEGGMGEWLEQTLHRTLFEKGLTDTFIGQRRSENDGQCTSAAPQILLQFRA